MAAPRSLLLQLTLLAAVAFLSSHATDSFRGQSEAHDDSKRTDTYGMDDYYGISELYRRRRRSIAPAKRTISSGHAKPAARRSLYLPADGGNFKMSSRKPEARNNNNYYHKRIVTSAYRGPKERRLKSEAEFSLEGVHMTDKFTEAGGLYF